MSHDEHFDPKEENPENFEEFQFPELEDFSARSGELEDILPEDYEEILPDDLAMDALGLTDPAEEEVERILREAKEQIDEPTPPKQQEELPGQTGEEFRDQEYRDAFDEYFERAFDESEDAQDDDTESTPPPARHRRKPIKKRGSGLLGIPHFLSSLILWAIVLGVSFTLARVVWVWADDVLALTKQEREVTITIVDSDSMQDITQKLWDAGLIRYPKLFNAYSSLTNARDKISAGTFTLNCIYDYHALVNAMGRSSFARTEVKVMIPEGYVCQQIFELLEKNGVCTVAELEEAASSGDVGEYWFLEDVDRGTSNCLEGFLFPDTYDFYTDDDPERVIRKMLRNFDYRFDETLQDDIEQLNEWLGEKLAGYGYSQEEIDARRMTVRDVVIVASMIERETAGTSESATIASVIYNRLCDPDTLYLGIDATVQYALGEWKATLTYEDLQVNSPYNTYKNAGLPVGPISNPGLSSLRAALHPEDTNYYYYALDVDRTHHFSETYEEHQAFLESLKHETGESQEP